jgi:hypothetical protein
VDLTAEIAEYAESLGGIFNILLNSPFSVEKSEEESEENQRRGESEDTHRNTRNQSGSVRNFV